MSDMLRELCNLLPAFVIAAIIFYEIAVRSKRHEDHFDTDDYRTPPATRLLS